MKVEVLKSINFKRRLRPSEEKEYSEILQKGKKAVGNTGMSTLIVPSSSLPQKETLNTGVGSLLSDSSEEFFKFAKQYWGIDSIQLLPEGNFKYIDGMALPYSGSCLDFGNQMINLEALTKDEFGKILTDTDLKSVVDANSSAMKNVRANYENVITISSPTENVLKKGFKELLKADTDKKKEILKQFETFEMQNAERLEPKSLFYALTNEYNNPDTRSWKSLDHNLFDEYVIDEATRLERIKQIKETHPEEIRFYKFKQFLAERQLELSKERLHKKGLTLSGDMSCGFSYDELWANPKAFHKNRSIGWGLPALNLDTVEGQAMLRKKVQHYAKQYDKIRVDAAWTYCLQPIKNKDLNVHEKKNYQGRILDIIEDEFKKHKGASYKKEDIMYEIVAGKEDYNPFDGFTLKPEVKDRIKIYCSDYLGSDWGSTAAFKNRNWANGSYMLGVSNHDSEIYKVLEDEARKRTQIDELANILKIPKEKLSATEEFVKAKYAEIMRSKHNMFFFTDSLNLDGYYQKCKNDPNNYRIKVPESYQDHYFKSLEQGKGLNIMDALEKAFKAEGLDKSQKDLYKKIRKYRKILQEPEGLAKNKIVAIVVAAVTAIGTATGIILNKNNKAKQHQDKI